MRCSYTIDLGFAKPARPLLDADDYQRGWDDSDAGKDFDESDTSPGYSWGFHDAAYGVDHQFENEEVES